MDLWCRVGLLSSITRAAWALLARRLSCGFETKAKGPFEIQATTMHNAHWLLACCRCLCLHGQLQAANTPPYSLTWIEPPRSIGYKAAAAVTPALPLQLAVALRNEAPTMAPLQNPTYEGASVTSLSVRALLTDQPFHGSGLLGLLAIESN